MGASDTRASRGPAIPPFDLAALLLSLLAVFAAYLTADRVYERVPHLEDEIAYVWQAKAMADGALTVPSPVIPKKFLVPFVVDLDGQRFGKYPLGWPALLSVGVQLGLRDWVNPLLAGLAVWLTYQLGKKLLGEIAGLLAALLTVTSPFFLMNTGSLLSHPLGLVLSIAFALSWWDTVQPPEDRRVPGWVPLVAAGGTIGVLALARPFTAVGVAAPFALHGLWLLQRGRPELKKRILAVAGVGLLVGSLHLLWQAAATGDPFLNPYELWWSYDKVGFGPGHGVVEPQGHTLRQAWLNTKFSLRIGWQDLFGWPGFSWLFLPFGLWASRENDKLLLTASVAGVLLVFYMAYWVGAWTFGPRYQFEGLHALTLLSAAGVCWLAGWPQRPGEPAAAAGGRLKFRRLGMTALLGLLVSMNLLFYTPPRMDAMTDLYGISRKALAPFEQAADLAPAVVIVHADKWMPYGALLELQDPFLTSPFIFVWRDQPGMTDYLKAVFPERAIFHYYPEEPGVFYTGPRE